MLEFDMVTTRGGDFGDSSLYDGSRLRKDDLLFTTMGNVDELSSHLGVLKSSLGRKVIHRRRTIKEITAVQTTLIRIGAMIATATTAELYASIDVVTKDDVKHLEEVEHALLKDTEIPDQFVLPGETREGALADVARAVCRRAERAVVACIRDKELAHLIACQHYLNRLSDYLFILGRSLS